MIVIGADTHKHSHTVAAVDAATGRARGDRTARARRRSFDDLLRWSRGVGAERVWAIEDCRHVSGALERFLLERGERVVRVAPKLMADARRFGARARQVRHDRRRRDRPGRDPRGTRHPSRRAVGGP
jgi:transposase